MTAARSRVAVSDDAVVGARANDLVQATAHDLREPLRMMTAFCDLVARDYGQGLDSRGREYLTLAKAATAQMQALIDGLGEFGRAQAAADHRGWFEAGECLDQAIGLLGDPVYTSGAQITHGALPRLFGDRLGFVRLMQNLVGNGVKYVGPEVRPVVHVSAIRDGAFWRFSVADNGIGVDARDHVRIFEPFKRLHASDRYAGSGLGLAICRRLVEEFGGRIWLRSAPGEGSVFNFTVDACEEAGRDG